MNLMIFDGQLGSGKTLGMSLIALDYHYKSGCTLYSNYGLKKSYPIVSYNDFLHVARQGHSIILLDEAHVFLDSRMSRNQGIIYFTQMSYYFRKMKTTVMITSPDISSIDKRLRQLSNIYVFVEKNQREFIYNYYDVQTEKKLKTFRVKKDYAIKIGHEIYNTNEIVEPMILPKTEDEYRRFLNKLKSVI